MGGEEVCDGGEEGSAVDDGEGDGSMQGWVRGGRRGTWHRGKKFAIPQWLG